MKWDGSVADFTCDSIECCYAEQSNHCNIDIPAKSLLYKNRSWEHVNLRSCSEEEKLMSRCPFVENSSLWFYIVFSIVWIWLYTYRNLCEDVKEKWNDREIQANSRPSKSFLEVLWHCNHLLKKEKKRSERILSLFHLHYSNKHCKTCKSNIPLRSNK